MALAWAALRSHRSSASSAVNWAATKRIFEGSWRDLLADELAPERAELGVEEHDGLAVHHPVLRAAERQHVDAGVDRERPQPSTCRRARRRRWRSGRRRCARVMPCRARPRTIAATSSARVERAELGRLRDRHDRRAGRGARSPSSVGDASICSGRSLPSAVGTSISLAPTNRSGAPVSSTLMWADSVQTTACAGPSMPWQRRDVGAGAAPHEAHLDVGAEQVRNARSPAAVQRSSP